ncbi:MAG: ADP-forming succinate--CoA ligase subunit beta [Euryarchaeota archaeon]|nr:ADP-forming succinate--CoA ligase subunit beta [Euryarchaeota archaeon]
MKLQEFQAKSILLKYGIQIPKGRVAISPEEARKIAEELKKPVAMKAQVLVGGRGKVGGIKFAEFPKDVKKVVSSLLGASLDGFPVRKVLVEEKLDILKELFVSVTLDRGARKVLVLASRTGGVDVETIVERFPEKLIKYPIDIRTGLREFEGRVIAKKLGFSGEQCIAIGNIIKKLSDIYFDLDAELVEINPLVLSKSNELCAADAKIIIDDNALFRHQDLVKEFGPEASELSDEERLAKEQDLIYVELDGNIGVIGNGAGLVMATLDLVSQFGGKPANFLDLGGGTSTEVVIRALKFIHSKPNVKVILINVFAGITRCDEVARGIVTAIKEYNIQKPITVRLTGTNEAEGKKILEENKTPFFDSMFEAAKKAVSVAKELNELKKGHDKKIFAL